MRRTAVLRRITARGKAGVMSVRLFESLDDNKLGEEIDYPDDWPDTISELFLACQGFTVVFGNLMGVITEDRNED